MKVTELDIQSTIDTFNASESSPEILLDEIFEEHQGLFHYLHSGILDPLPENDRAFFFFLITVVLKTLLPKLEGGTEINVKAILDYEEENWTLFNDQKGLFRTKLDVFFENYQEEDLLSFIEDSLAVDENDILSLASRELIFITIKSIIDSCVN